MEEVSRFEEFWEVWPSPKDPRYSDYKRKTDKKKCRELWQKQNLDAQAPVIIRDVSQRAQHDKGWLQQKGEFLSAPLVYLRNERWDGSEWADTRDERKAKQVQATPTRPSSGPDISRYAKFANRVLLNELRLIGGTGSKPGEPSEALLRTVNAKNEIVSQAERDGDWDDTDFVSVIKKTIHDAIRQKAA